VSAKLKNFDLFIISCLFHFCVKEDFETLYACQSVQRLQCIYITCTNCFINFNNCMLGSVVQSCDQIFLFHTALCAYIFVLHHCCHVGSFGLYIHVPVEVCCMRGHLQVLWSFDSLSLQWPFFFTKNNESLRRNLCVSAYSDARALILESSFDIFFHACKCYGDRPFIVSTCVCSFVWKFLLFCFCLASKLHSSGKLIISLIYF
jgi:hypothetical protein